MINFRVEKVSFEKTVNLNLWVNPLLVSDEEKNNV